MRQGLRRSRAASPPRPSCNIDHYSRASVFLEPHTIHCFLFHENVRVCITEIHAACHYMQKKNKATLQMLGT